MYLPLVLVLVLVLVLLFFLEFSLVSGCGWGGPAAARSLVRCLALCLAAACAALAVHGVRAGIAQTLYFRAKFGGDRDDLPRIVRHCETAWRLYPRNYYFPMWTAERAYYLWNAGGGDASTLDVARAWCGAGLALNPYPSPLRLLRTRLLRLDSPERAAAYWEEYVAWNFWNPHHHAVLAELYAVDGRWGKAMEALQWVKGSRHYEETRRTLNQLWREQMRPPE